LADLEGEESNHHSQVLWTRGLLIRRNIANGDLAYFTTWCPAETSIKTLVSVSACWRARRDFATSRSASTTCTLAALSTAVRGEAVAPAHESCDVLALAGEEAAAVRDGDPPSHLTHGSGKMTNAAHKKSGIAAPFSGSVAAGPTRKPNIADLYSVTRGALSRRKQGFSPLGSAIDFNELAMGLVRFGHFWGVFGEFGE
jgi:hypothetical protein